MNEETFEVEKKDLDAEYFQIGIIGTNTTAKSLEHAFKYKPRNDIMVVDNINKHLEDLIEFEPNITFLCNDVKETEDGVVDAAELEDCLLQLSGKTNSGMVIKTSLPMSLVERSCKNKKVVYNPDLFFRSEDIDNRLNRPFSILGGNPGSTMAIAEIYHRFSTMNCGHYHHVSPVEACFIEQSIGSIMVMKSVFFSQLYDTVREFGGDYHTIQNIISNDLRIGGYGGRVPNTDGTYGENNKQAIKALNSLKAFSDRFTVLENCGIMNERYQERN